jgi:hypothetical protein
MVKEKQFVIIIGMSFFKNPYQVQLPRPINKTINIPSEIPSAFFSRNILTNWGNNDIEVSAPANMPIY